MIRIFPAPGLLGRRDFSSTNYGKMWTGIVKHTPAIVERRFTLELVELFDLKEVQKDRIITRTKGNWYEEN